MKLIITTVLVATIFHSPAFSQKTPEYYVRGNIGGLSGEVGVVVVRIDGSRQVAKVREGRFLFEIGDVINGENIFLSINDTLTKMTLIAEKNMLLSISGDVTNWPNCSFAGSTAQLDLEDFNATIQKPYEVAYQTWKGELSDKSLDSTQLTEKGLIYNQAIDRYREKTLQWIRSHPASLLSPDLILRWWPRNDWENAYANLGPYARDSFFGERLKKEITRDHFSDGTNDQSKK